MKAPHFLVVGAQKSGTTWLAENLAAHPEVYSPREKEIHFFDKAERYAMGENWYSKQFIAANEGQVCGEYTPNYLWEPKEAMEASESSHLCNVAERAKSFDPSIKWIALLRNPVDRAISAYYHHVRAGRISPHMRISDVWHRYGIRSMGLYAHNLQPWLDSFPKRNCKILIFEDSILSRPSETLRNLYSFLGVDSNFHPNSISQVRNSGSSHFLLRLSHRAPMLARLLQKVDRSFGNSWSSFHIPVHSEERNALEEFFEEPNRALSELLGINLPWDSNVDQSYTYSEPRKGDDAV